MSSNPSPLNAAQFAALQAEYAKRLEAVVADVNLRKWLVEKILENVTPINVSMDVLQRLHDFIVASAKESFPRTDNLPKESERPDVS